MAHMQHSRETNARQANIKGWSNFKAHIGGVRDGGIIRPCDVHMVTTLSYQVVTALVPNSEGLQRWTHYKLVKIRYNPSPLSPSN
mmetsp:Transcript_29101/g.72572  ORF Transcript_29101/g.72572 Transcript_29101/m.72572 type:complete len:85 (-) Transcript_29101:705-959(-)